MSSRPIDELRVEDQLRWLTEILENSRERLLEFDFVEESFTAFVSALVEAKVLSGFNQKAIGNIPVVSDKVDKLHECLPKKGWENFKKARAILYQLYPQLAKEGVWNESKIARLPVLNVKYLETDGATSTTATDDGEIEEVESDGEDVDGMFSTKSKSRDSGASAAADCKETSKWPEMSKLPSYSMTKRRKKGFCLIVNNENYASARLNEHSLKDRKGSTVDAEATKNLFKKLGFDVEPQDNLTRTQLDDVLNMIVNDFPALDEYNCFVAVFLSHGENEALNCVDGRDKKIDDIINMFKGDSCKALRGIPKWFIIQACRGKSFNTEVLLEHDAKGDDNDIEQQSSKPISIPACADFYISYATAPGYYSFRNTKDGSWFIQCLLETLAKFAKYEDVNTMMTRVNRKVALGFHHNFGGEYVKQMPYHVNMLTGSLQLSTTTRL